MPSNWHQIVETPSQFVETPCKFITAKLSIRKPRCSSSHLHASQQIRTLWYIYIRACELNKSHIISTDEDPGLQTESFAVINLRVVSTKKSITHFLVIMNFAYITQF
jgi:hypothetical protein